MASSHPLSKIVVPIRRYLDRQLVAHELVRIVDDLVAQDFLFGLEPQAVRIIDQLHESLALYVADEISVAKAIEGGIFVGISTFLVLQRVAASPSQVQQFEKAFWNGISSFFLGPIFAVDTGVLANNVIKP